MTTMIGVELLGRRVLVVGGGSVSARRARGFSHDGAIVVVVAPELVPAFDSMLEGGLISWLPRRVEESDLAGAWFVHTATGSPETDLAVAGWADARRVWCVNAGDASFGSARIPAVRTVGEVLVGVVSTEGSADPRRSAGIATQLAHRLTESLVEELAARLREGSIDLRRRRPRGPGHGRVTLVGGGPGAVDLLTVRGRRALSEADVVVTDRLGPIGVLGELAEGVEIIDVGKNPGHHPVPQDEINRILVEQAALGRVVVRLKGGDPFIYGRGGEEVQACRAAGIPVEVVPGISSSVAAASAAGIPVTHRGVADSFHVMTGHEGLGERAQAIMRDSKSTLVVLMGVGSLGRMTAAAIASGVAVDTPVAIVERGTTPEQRTTRGTLGDIVGRAADAQVENPAVIVIGQVARLGLLDCPVEAESGRYLSSRAGRIAL